MANRCLTYLYNNRQTSVCQLTFIKFFDKYDICIEIKDIRR
jgi:hypothetical protein